MVRRRGNAATTTPRLVAAASDGTMGCIHSAHCFMGCVGACVLMMQGKESALPPVPAVRWLTQRRCPLARTALRPVVTSARCEGQTRAQGTVSTRTVRTRTVTTRTITTRTAATSTVTTRTITTRTATTKTAATRKAQDAAVPRDLPVAPPAKVRSPHSYQAGSLLVLYVRSHA
jgi:hypothetical protein